MSRHAGSELATEVAATLWPEHDGIAVARRNPFAITDSVRDFALVPSARRPIYLVPPVPGAAVALNPAVGGLRHLQRRVLAGLQRGGLLGRLPGPRLWVRAPYDGIETALTGVLGEVGSLVIRLGRPRVNRAIVFWVLDPAGEPLAVVKANYSREGRATLETEYAALSSVPRHPVPDLRRPEPLAYLRWRNLDLLVITPLIAARPNHTPTPPLAQMRALAAANGSDETPLAQTPYAADLEHDLARIRRPDDRAWLTEAWRRLLDEYGQLPVRTGACHGDWVSWNMAFDGDEVLLWDWEHYRRDALAGLDHLHFLAQEARRRSTDRASEQAWLVQARDALRTGWGVGEEQGDAVLRAYLIDVNARFTRDRPDGPGGGAAVREGWGRPLVEQLARQRQGRPVS